jgi:hypothetical protein
VALHKMNGSLAVEDAEYKHAVDLLKVRMEKAVISLNSYKRQMQSSVDSNKPALANEAHSGVDNKTARKH